jgi:hypothetical protein
MPHNGTKLQTAKTYPLMSRSFEYSVSFPSKDFHHDQIRDARLTITLIDFNPKWSLGKYPSQLAISATEIRLNL